MLSRCTVQKECAQGLLARSWISMGEGPQQCPSMTLTPPEISISADIKVGLDPCCTPRCQVKRICFSSFPSEIKHALPFCNLAPLKTSRSLSYFSFLRSNLGLFKYSCMQ